MRRRPVALILCALSFLYYPGELLWRYASGVEVSPADILFSIVLPAVLLYGLIRVHKFGWYTLIAFGALWGIRDIQDFYSVYGDSLMPIVLHISVYVMSLAYFINPRIRHVYFDPKLRWWRSKSRFETHGPAVVEKNGKADYPVLKNISEGGCFLETPHLMEMNSELRLSIPLPVPLNVSMIQATGEVRWASADPRRPGMGIQFKNLEKRYLKAVKTYVKRQL